MLKYLSPLGLSGITITFFLLSAGTAHAFSLRIPSAVERILPSATPKTQVKGMTEEFELPPLEENNQMQEFNDEHFQQVQQQEQEEESRNKENDARQLQDMKRGAQQMSFGLKNFESMIKQLEKDKITIPQEIKDTFTRAKELIETAKNAGTLEEFQKSGAEELQEIFSELEQFRVEFVENEMRMRDIRRMLKNIGNPLKQFEKQLSALEKKKISIPAEMKENLAKIKSIVTAVQNAKTWDDAESAGVEELQSLMENMGETQQQLEHLSRWPKTMQEMDRELKRLTQELKRAKGIADKLAKKGMDLSSIYAEFETAINALKDVRERADALMRGGNIEDAFALIEEEFFSQLGDVWENHKIIMTMSNFGRFSQEFKQGIKDAQRVIKDLKRKKINTTELETILAQAKTQGDAVLQLMKTTPDPEDILEALQELENLRQWFEEKADQLRGEEETLPWKEGDPLFKDTLQLPSDWEKAMPQKME